MAVSGRHVGFWPASASAARSWADHIRRGSLAVLSPNAPSFLPSSRSDPGGPIPSSLSLCFFAIVFNHFLATGSLQTTLPSSTPSLYRRLSTFSWSSWLPFPPTSPSSPPLLSSRLLSSHPSMVLPFPARLIGLSQTVSLARPPSSTSIIPAAHHRLRVKVLQRSRSRLLLEVDSPCRSLYPAWDVGSTLLASRPSR